MITGIKPCGICGKRGWASTGADPTPSQGCVCSADWSKTMMGSGLQQPGNIICRSIKAMKYLSLDVADCIEKGPQLAELPDV
jgi:hypothetical protein